MDELTQYYYSIYPGLVSAMEAEGIDPRWAGVVAPQVMIETSWGKSPATKYHNYFGMKAAKNQNGVTFSTNEGYGDDTIRIRDNFLAFPSREEGLRQGVRRLRDKFNAFEGKPSTEQYVKNINSNPEQIYFTGNPEDYINNINKIKNGSRAKAAIKQYAKDVKNTFLEAQSAIPNPSEDSRIERPQPIFTPRGDVRKAMQDKVDYHNFMNSISIQNNPQPTYNPPMKFDDGGELYYPKQWNDLTMAEKAEMMKVAVQNGITTLPEIRERYNEFAKGGYVPSDRIKDRITHYEGKTMTGAIDPLSGKYSKNNSFESEAKGFYNALPEDIRDQVLSNPELADSLYSYSYNVGAGNFKKRVVPTLRRYYQGNATVSDIEKSMWASGDSKLRGLQRRRAEERAGVRSALAGNNPIYPTRFSDSENLPFTPFYNEVFNTPLSSYNVPTVTLPIEEPLVQAAEDYAYSKEALDRQERQDRLNAFNMLLSMSNPNSSGNSLMDTVGMLTGRNFAQGGRKYDGLTQNNQQMSNPLKPNIFRRPDGSYFYQEKPSSQEINVTPMNTVFDDPSQWTYVDDEGRQYTPHQSPVNNTGTITQGEDNNPLVKAANNYFRELAYRSTYDPSSIALQGKYTMPAIAASALLPLAGEAAYPLLTNPYVDAGITSAFGAHGLNKLFRGEINGPLDAAMTALELAPLGRLAKPAFEMGYRTAKPIFDRAVTSLQNNYPAIFDPYTSWDATLGYHGDNIFSRALGTVGRRYGFTPKAEVPEFHRRLTIYRPSQLKLDEEGNMIISSGRTGEGHDGIVNFATSEPARGHSSHKSLSGIDDYIIDSKAIGNQDFKSIQPSDTFFETGQLAIDPKSMTLVSGNTEMLDYARSLGMRTLSSPRLRQLTASRMTKEDVINSRSEGIRKFLQNVGEIKYGKGQENAGQIGEEMQRLTSMRGTPTMQDYSYFEGLTGLNSGVRPAEMWNGTKEQGLELFGNWGKPRRTPTFNHVAYAPASNIEAIYREAKMGTRPWKDYYTALENMPSARQQLGLNSAMDTYLGEPIVPEGYLTVKPQVRTRVGDVEIDDPNLLYHLDRGNGVGAFSNQGAYVENGMLLPGIAKEGEVPYSWWNLGRPYSTSVNGQPMTRLMTVTEDAPGMLHVRSQNYPIGQWNGKRGFVTNAEYVNPEGVNVSGSTYTLDSNYGWRRVYAEESPAAEWPTGRTTPQITAENAAKNGMRSSAESINVEHSLDNISRFEGSSPIPTGHQGMVGYRPKQKTAVWDSTKQDMVPLKSIDEVPNLRETINSILHRIKTEDIRPEFLNENAYVNTFRDNATRQGININDLSHEDVAKILTEQYNQLKEGSSGILKDNVLWRTWGRTIPPNEFNWQEHLGEFTQNKGFWGEGNYFSTGVYGSDIVNQPYMINNITDVGYDDLIGATTKAGDAIREGKDVGSQLATRWMSEAPNTRIVAATENGARNRYGWLDTGDPGIEIVTQKNTGIKALNPDLTIGNGETFPRDWSNPNVFKGLLLPFGIGLTGYGILGRDR